MKIFQVMLGVAISFLALTQCISNGNLAAFLSSSPNAGSHGTRSNSKIMRVKRREAGIHCIPYGSSTPICSKAYCPFKPSPPSDMKIDFYLNTTTKELHLNITWKEPKFGLNNLCGYQLEYGSLNNVETICIQLNSKNAHSYSIPNVRFSEKYEVSVVSLPASENIEESKMSVRKKSPEECTMLRKANTSLPLQCTMRNNFPVVCEDGFINVTLDTIYNKGVDRYYSFLVRGGLPELSINQHEKNQPFAVYHNLTLGVKYQLFVSAEKKDNKYRVHSETFICKEKTSDSTPASTTAPSILPPQENGEDVLLITLLIILSCMILLLFAFISIKFKLMYKRQNLSRNSHLQDTSFSSESISLQGQSKEYQSRVLFVYPFGCTYVEEFVVVLDQLLTMMDFWCVLDLNMERDRDIFMMKKLNELQQDDYVIFVNYKDTDARSQYALRRHEEMICKRIFHELLSDKNFISIQFDAQGTTNMASNIQFAVDTKNELERFIRLIFGIPKYQLGKKCPQKNTIEVHPYTESLVLSEINNVMATVHPDCQITSCCRGKHAVQSLKTHATIGKAISTNSFGSDYVVNDKCNKEQLSRLSSSEPLLKII